MRARWDTVLLDLDGTLSDAGPAIARALAAALREVGAPPLPDAVLRRFVGPPLQDSLAELPGFDGARVTRALAAYRRAYAADGLRSSPLYDGVPDALRALRAAGLRLGLATSKPQPFAEQVVEASGLAALLDVVAGSGLDGSRRSKASVVAHALALLPPTDAAVMVGDRSHDVVGAAGCGLPCVGVLWGYGDEAELREAGAVALAADPAALVRLLTA